LTKVAPNNRQGQYYLTDCAAILLADGRRVVAQPCLEISEVLGVNSPEQLADVEAVLTGT
jgi:bifunctional UDP-N-acetylglucosamine pyrophosphorylase/glucosamine-1-phosphate N-acetyltransferase